MCSFVGLPASPARSVLELRGTLAPLLALLPSSTAGSRLPNWKGTTLSSLPLPFSFPLPNQLYPGVVEGGCRVIEQSWTLGTEQESGSSKDHTTLV